MKSMIFWGAGGHARVLRDCMDNDEFRLIAVFDNDPQQGSPFSDVPVFHAERGFDAWRTECPEEAPGFLIAVGGDRGRERIELADWLIGRGLQPLTARHSTAYIAGRTKLGAGCHVLAHAVVAAGVRLGRQCIINTGAIVDHECRLADGVHVGPGACISGCVDVGAFSFIGAGATILPRLRIGPSAIVGAGATVIRDVEEGQVVAGNPARPIRQEQ